MGITPPIAIGPTMVIRPWIDPVVDDRGHDPMSMFVETDWLPVLGPTATWLYRRLGSWALAYPDGLELVTVELAQSIGLGGSTAHGSKLDHALRRLVRFGAAEWRGAELFVRRSLSTPPQKRIFTSSSGDLA